MPHAVFPIRVAALCAVLQLVSNLSVFGMSWAFLFGLNVNAWPNPTMPFSERR